MPFSPTSCVVSSTSCSALRRTPSYTGCFRSAALFQQIFHLYFKGCRMVQLSCQHVQETSLHVKPGSAPKECASPNVFSAASKNVPIDTGWKSCRRSKLPKILTTYVAPGINTSTRYPYSHSKENRTASTNPGLRLQSPLQVSTLCLVEGGSTPARVDPFSKR